MSISTPERTGITRRRLVQGAAWSVPVIAMTSAAPALATSLRKDPGINGWVLNSPTDLRGQCNWSLRVNSNPNNPPSTTDGAPFGLYIYDTIPGDVVTNAKITYWIIGNQTAVWTRNTGGSACWKAPVRGTPSVKTDGLTYTPYTFEYNHTGSGCALTLRPDGRLWFPHFDYTAEFTQPQSYCDDVTYWVQRYVMINGQAFTFERRNGTRGTFSTARRLQASEAATSTELPA